MLLSSVNTNIHVNISSRICTIPVKTPAGQREGRDCSFVAKHGLGNLQLATAVLFLSLMALSY